MIRDPHPGERGRERHPRSAPAAGSGCQSRREAGRPRERCQRRGHKAKAKYQPPQLQHGERSTGNKIK